MKITRKQLRQIILEALSDNSGRRIVRPSTGPRFPNAVKPLHPPPVSFNKTLEDIDASVKEKKLTASEGKPTIALNISDIQFDPNKEKSLTAESPFVGGSPNFHATYSANYTDEDLRVIFKKRDIHTGVDKYGIFKRDLPDIKEGDYVIVWSLFQEGKLGVAEVISSYNMKKILDGKMVTIPLLTIKTINPISSTETETETETEKKLQITLSNVGKAFVKKIAGARSLEKVQAYEAENFNTFKKGHRK